MPNGLLIAIVVITVLLALQAVVRITAAAFARRDPGGQAEFGEVIFCESIRWLNIPWGASTTAAGLRRAGYRGAFTYWRWHGGWRGTLVLPAIMDRKFLEAEAQRLAEHLVAQRAEHPDRPLYLMGYSCGTFIATRALELLPEGVIVDGLALIAGAFSPKRDLNPAAEHVRGRIVVCSSVCDGIVLLGTLVFGTADRKFTPSIGAIGYRGPACEKVNEIRWQPGMIGLGWLGEHFTAPATRLISKHVWPLLRDTGETPD
jgi:pimeloyl-ACP methyl ester carboxylesterase